MKIIIYTYIHIFLLFNHNQKANSILLEKIMGNVDDNEKVNDILKHSKMRCGGCGSKIGSQVLSRALKVVSQVRIFLSTLYIRQYYDHYICYSI